MATTIPIATAMLSSKFMERVSAEDRTFLRGCVTIKAVPASASIPNTRASRPAPARSRLRPVFFAVLVALVPTALATWAVGRNHADHVSRTASSAVVGEAQAGRQQAEQVLSRARARALTIAHFVPVQRALTRRDEKALALFARQHPGSYFLLRGKEIPARHPSEVARRTVVVTLGKHAIGTVAVGVPESALRDAVDQVPRADGDRIGLSAAGTAPAGAGDISLGDRRYRAAGANVSSRIEVVAARPASAIDRDVRNTWLTAFGAAVATLATVALIAWAAAPLVGRGRMIQRERSEALSVLSNVRDGVFLVDEDGLVRFWNRAAELITGLSRTDVWGRRLAELPGLGSIAGQIPVGEDGQVRPQTLPVELGVSELWLSVAGVETLEGKVYTFTDITEEQRLEQLKNDFVATVSHELRTPLTGLYGAAVTLRERGGLIPATARAQLLAAIGDQAELLARVVEDILVAAGIESDQLLFTEHSFEAVALAREAVEEARLRHSTTRVQLVQDEEDLFVHADSVRTRQVLDSLIDNAVRYATRGPIWVAVERVNGAITFSVADKGPGIPLDKQQRIFEKFYRSDVQMMSGVGGAGLGLYISRELVRLMGGRLWVESAPGAGALFSFELPSLPD